MIEINGVELELDLSDADVLDTVQDAVENLTIEAVKSERIGDQIRQPCITINNFFDEVFGEGAADAVFKGKMNIEVHMDAFVQVVEEIGKAPEKIRESQEKYLKAVKKNPNFKQPMDRQPKTRPATNKKFASVK